MRKSELFQTRDMNKTVKDVRSERDFGSAKIKSYAGKHNTIEIKWDLNDNCKHYQMFKITIGNEEAIVSAEEFQRYLRWV